jgi:hypothetical protein
MIEMVQHLNYNTNLEIDKVEVPHLDNDGVSIKQFKVFYSLHRNTLFQPLLDLFNKISMLLFTPETLSNICNYATISHNGKYHRIFYLIEHLERDQFESKHICVTAKRRKSIQQSIESFNSDTTSNDNVKSISSTVDNRMSPTHTTSNMFPRNISDNELHDLIKMHNFFTQLSQESFSND